MEKTEGAVFGRKSSDRSPREKKDYISIDPMGQSERAAEKSIKRYGGNSIAPAKQKGFFRLLCESFNDPIIKILLAALGVNALVSLGRINLPETLGIAAAVLVATFVSAASEYSSSKAFEKLRSGTHERCFVRRGGELYETDTDSLAVGDIVHLSAGMNVPADGILISGKLTVDQAALTGESAQKEKTASASRCVCPDEMIFEPEERTQVFRGSGVFRGEGEMCVLRTGNRTFLGQVAQSLGENNRQSPLKHRLSDLAHSISFMGYVGAGMIAFAYLFNSFFISSGMDMARAAELFRDKSFVISEVIRAVTVAVSAVVMAVPEGLPMLVTVVLSSNMKKMLRSGVLVRKLTGIETAGSMNILFTDKTGTLTTGKMSVLRAVGAGFSAENIRQLPKKVSHTVADCVRASCGETGSATEAALKKFAPGGTSPEKRFPFDPERKYSAGYNGKYSYFAGAAEKLLEKCTSYLAADGTTVPMDGKVREALASSISAFAEKACRVLCLARCAGNNLTNAENLTFICLTAIRDPLRSDAASSVAAASGAGIHVVMVTGDNPVTAAAVAKDCGIIAAGRDLVLNASELRGLSDPAAKELLPRLAVVARALPSDKMRLVRLSQETGLTAGMTGDGINDAPALTAADVGFAMGSGTETAKEAGDIVITDDSFSSITKAVLYGRTIFESIRKFIVFQLLMNFSAMGISLIGPFVGIECPVTVIQMLWVNMIMDTLGGIAFAGEPALSEYMKRRPLSRDAKILTGGMLAQILLTGSYTLALSVYFLKNPGLRAYFGGSDGYYLTAFFAMFIFCGIFNSFNARTERINVLSRLSGNGAFVLIMTLVAAVQLLMIYFGGEVFRCTPLLPRHLFTCALIAFTVIPADVLRKLIVKAVRG